MIFDLNGDGEETLLDYLILDELLEEDEEEDEDDEEE